MWPKLLIENWQQLLTIGNKTPRIVICVTRTHNCLHIIGSWTDGIWKGTAGVVVGPPIWSWNMQVHNLIGSDKLENEPSIIPHIQSDYRVLLTIEIHIRSTVLYRLASWSVLSRNWLYHRGHSFIGIRASRFRQVHLNWASLSGFWQTNWFYNRPRISMLVNGRMYDSVLIYLNTIRLSSPNWITWKSKVANKEVVFVEGSFMCKNRSTFVSNQLCHYNCGYELKYIEEG